MKYILSLLLAIIIVFSVPIASINAQTTVNNTNFITDSVNTSTATTSINPCAALSNNLFIGLYDRNTNYQVSALQRFLNTQGLLAVSPTGYFGQLTFSALKNFQIRNNINGTGYFGSLSRARVQAISCGNPIDPTPTPVPSPTAKPVIQSVSGPTQLYANQNGTWTITAYDSNSINPYFTQASGLTYSVDWGDQLYAYPASAGASTNSPFISSQTSTFNHSYSYTGTYTVTFTVRNAYGAQTSSTISVNVFNNTGGTVTPPVVTPPPTTTPPPTIGLRPILYSLSPQASKVGDKIVITGGNFYSGENTIYFNNGYVVQTYANNTSSGQVLTFDVPTYYSPSCSPGLFCRYLPAAVLPGTYNVTVSNSNGTSGSLPLTIYDNTQGTTLAPKITGYQSYTVAGDYGISEHKTVVLTGTGFSLSNTIYVNGVATYFNRISNNSIQLTFDVARNTTGCNQYMCTDVYRPPYNNFNVSVENVNGKSNEIYIDLSDAI